jgi:hypothetical protein
MSPSNWVFHSQPDEAVFVEGNIVYPIGTMSRGTERVQFVPVMREGGEVEEVMVLALRGRRYEVVLGDDPLLTDAFVMESIGWAFKEASANAGGDA